MCRCHARRADARLAGRKRSQLQLRYSHPRRADARRSLGRAFVHRKNRFLAEGRSHCSTRAGGVSPPWGLLTRMQQASVHTVSAVRRTGALVSAQTCFPHPRRADARCSLRSPVADRGLIFTAQGRLGTPRRADARSAGRKRSQLQLRYSHHGGLTPAALVHVRLCTANVVILPADGRCNSARSGGRKPPVECTRHASSKRGYSTHCSCRYSLQPTVG